MISDGIKILETVVMTEAGGLAKIEELKELCHTHKDAQRARHTQTHTRTHRAVQIKEIVLPSIKISHLLKLVPHHLLLMRHREGKRERRRGKKKYMSFITTMSQYSVLQLHLRLLIQLHY